MDLALESMKDNIIQSYNKGSTLYRIQYRTQYRERYRTQYRERYRTQYRERYRTQYRERYVMIISKPNCKPN